MLEISSFDTKIICILKSPFWHEYVKIFLWLLRVSFLNLAKISFHQSFINSIVLFIYLRVMSLVCHQIFVVLSFRIILRHSLIQERNLKYLHMLVKSHLTLFWDVLFPTTRMYRAKKGKKLLIDGKVTLDIILRYAFSYHTNVQSNEG